MIAQWRLFVAALRFVMRPGTGIDAAGLGATGSGAAGSGAAGSGPVGADHIAPRSATRFIPLVGVVVGLIGAATYWLAAQLWPTNVAVVLSMLASLGVTERRSTMSGLYWVFALLIEYNLLMSLSSANVPFVLPEFLPLGLIMIAGQAASRAMAVSVMATEGSTDQRAAGTDLSVALVLGLAPAALLGIPGLIGLASVIGTRLALGGWVLSRLHSGMRERLEVTQRVTAISFYLGALATWNYS